MQPGGLIFLRLAVCPLDRRMQLRRRSPAPAVIQRQYLSAVGLSTRRRTTMQRRRRIAVVSAVIAVVGCAPAAQPTDPNEVREQLDAYLASYEANDAAAISAFFAPNVVLMPPDTVATSGASAFEAGYGAFVEANDFVLTSTIEDLQVSGDLAVARVTFEQTITPKTGAAGFTEAGSWLIVWGRQADGAWKITMEIWSAYPPQ